MACLDEQINWVYGTTEIQLIEERFFINSPGLDMSCISPASSLGWPTLRVLSGLGCSLWLGLVSCCESWEVKGGGPDFQAGGFWAKLFPKLLRQWFKQRSFLILGKKQEISSDMLLDRRLRNVCCTECANIKQHREINFCQNTCRRTW